MLCQLSYAPKYRVSDLVSRSRAAPASKWPRARRHRARGTTGVHRAGLPDNVHGERPVLENDWTRERTPPRTAPARVSTRIGAIAPSATLAVDAKAKALAAAGVDVVGFGAGEPDFPTPEHIVEAAESGLPPARASTTTPPRPACRSCARRSRSRPAGDSGYDVKANQVLVTNGGKQAVYNTFATLLDPGDEVLLPGALLDDLPRGDPARRRPTGRDPDDRRPGLQA